MTFPTSPYGWFNSAAAFFDLDRTLISGSSAYAFAVAAWRKDLIPASRLVRTSTDAARFRMAGASDAKTQATRDRVLAAVTGARQADLLALNGELIPKLLERIRPEARALLEMHRKAARDTYIVSASPQEVVEPLATALGMTGGIGTVATVVDGVYTGALDGPFCYGPGKAVAIRALAHDRGYDLRLSYAYSDSASDLPMLEAVGHPVAVNPDGPLEALAHARGWPVVQFHRQTRRVVKWTSGALAVTGAAGAAFAGGISLGRRTARQ